MFSDKTERWWKGAGDAIALFLGVLFIELIVFPSNFPLNFEHWELLDGVNKSQMGLGGYIGLFGSLWFRAYKDRDMIWARVFMYGTIAFIICLIVEWLPYDYSSAPLMFDADRLLKLDR